MSDPQPWYRWRPTHVFLVSGTLNIVGFALTQTSSWWWLILCALGTLGPGILRELGVLHDKDEFQQRATYRAAYHAFLATGVVAFVLYAYTRAGHRFEAAEELSSLYLAVLWFTWLFSSLATYWGPHRTAFRILIIFGCAWGVFNVLSNLTQPVALLMQLLITTAPFFLLAYLARRWPRVAGTLLIVLSVFFLVFYFRGFDRLAFLVKVGVAVLFVGPLLSSGLALLPRDEANAAPEAA